MKAIQFIILITTILFSITSFSQESDNLYQNRNQKFGDRYYERYAYNKAKNYYLKAVEKGHVNEQLMARLGDCHFFNGDYAEAFRWYSELVAQSSPNETYLHRYARTLRVLGKKNEADQLMDKLSGNTAEGETWRFKEVLSINEPKMNERNFIISPVRFNSIYSEYAPSIFGDSLVITSNRMKRISHRRKDNWNGAPFFELFIVDSTGNHIRPFNKIPRVRFHQSSVIFTKDGKTMYFTGNNVIDKKRRTDKYANALLKLYRMQLTEEGWGNVEELPFNNESYSVAHPALNPEETELIFASDMPGGKGDSDLYKVSIEGDGFGMVTSLGDNINTPGRDTFPFIDDNGNLYFASDGHQGHGGLDIFGAVLSEGDKYENVFNLGEPINSKADDFSFVMHRRYKKGFFASNREGGQGGDDLYSFKWDDGLSSKTTPYLWSILHFQDE